MVAEEPNFLIDKCTLEERIVPEELEHRQLAVEADAALIAVVAIASSFAVRTTAAQINLEENIELAVRIMISRSFATYL